VVCTSNDVTSLPPEFSRAERFDGVFFIDLPTAAERANIWNLYINRFLNDWHMSEPRYRRIGDGDDNWTGAEIRACCRLAALLDCPLGEAASYIVPVASTAGSKVSALREWASGKCLDASRGGIYSHIPTNPVTNKRRAIAAK